MKVILNDALTKGLNNEQLIAVTSTEGPLLVLAGAGTGKTKVLTSRIAYILSNNLAGPDSILAVTFTNKAAREIIHRIHNIYNTHISWAGTFHSIAARILRENADYFGLTRTFSIIDDSEQLDLIRSLSKAHNIDVKQHPPKLILARISAWKDASISVDKISGIDLSSPLDHVAFKIYKQYQSELVASNVADFGDLLLYNNILFLSSKEHLKHYQDKFKYILIDEYQDTNIAQYLWIRMLASMHKNICCVGDDDQSIYSWRGAEVANILNFSKDFPEAKIIKLEQNYRSTKQILDVASNLIMNNNHRHQKSLWSENTTGERVKVIACESDRIEARLIASMISSAIQQNINPNDVAILVRATFQTRVFEDILIMLSIPYQIIGGVRFYERAEIKDVICYIRISINNNDNLALERIINTPKRSIGASTLKIIKEYSYLHNISLIDAIDQLLNAGAFKAKAKENLSLLVYNIRNWQRKFQTLPPYEATKSMLDESGYLAMWKQEGTEEALSRIENINELLRALGEFNSIESFLEHASLNFESSQQFKEQSISIMTLHAAKGLEFEMVFLPGWEEGLFPNQKSLYDEGPKGLEEERRIAYVGVTRAKRYLTISYAQSRRMYNEFISSKSSRFIGEILDSVDLYTTNNGYLNKIGNNSTFRPKTASPAPSSIPHTNPYSLGARVRHKIYGIGIIIKKDEDNLEIAFGREIKKIKQSFVELAN